MAVPVAVQAQFTFSANNNGTLNISQYTGPGGAVTIPITTNGLTVTSIGSGAFQNCFSLTSVTIDTNIISIGNSAFSYCTSLTNATLGTNVATLGNGTFFNCGRLPGIAIPNSVTSIGANAFDYCGLTNITIGSGVTSLGNMLFQYCYKLTAITVSTNNSLYSSVGGVLLNRNQQMLYECPLAKAGAYTVPNNVLFIGQDSFAHCTNLTSVTISSSNVVSSIEEAAFQGCTKLTNVLIGTNVGGIGDNAFGGCSSLTNVMIPARVNSIGNEAFAGCTRLAAITVDPYNTSYSSVMGVLFDGSQTTVIQYPGGLSGSYTIPDGVTSIGQAAFDGCSRLTGVTMPDSVTSIGADAFLGCSLTDLTIPDSVTNIGGDAFGYCALLTGVTIPDGVTSIGSGTFEWCTGLTNVVIGTNVTSMGWDAFYWCSSLSSVYFRGNSPTLDPSGVFADDPNATTYYLPWTTGWDTFSANSGLASVPWLPQIQTGDGSFGVQSNQFGFNITWAGDSVVVVEACTSMANPDWTPVATNTLTGGSSYFSDAQWMNYPGRFYRVRSP